MQSGTVWELVDDWIGMTVGGKDKIRTRLRKGSKVRLFCIVGDVMEVFVEDEGTLFCIPSRMLRQVSAHPHLRGE